jgi:hypothetical protein
MEHIFEPRFLHETKSSAAVLSKPDASFRRGRPFLGQAGCVRLDSGTKNAIPQRLTLGQTGDGGSDQQ